MQDITKTARAIAGSPEDHLDNPHAFISAWASMKAARGQGFEPARLRPQHLIEGPAPAPEPSDQTLARVRARVRQIMHDRASPDRAA